MKPEMCNLKLQLILLVSFLFLSACAESMTPPAVDTPAARSAQAQDIATSAAQTVRIAATLSTFPTPPPDLVRTSVIAGTWYPDDPAELAAEVDNFLAAVEPIDGEPLGLIVPHAGYVYSGPVVARGFKQLAGKPYEVAVIIAADHQAPLSQPISVWTRGGFETPLGVVPVAEDLAQALVAADPRLTFNPSTHQGEHPIEIELPFLQRVCPSCRIVPVLMGADDEETVQLLADALLSVLPGRRAVVIASSDLSHYPQQADALQVDGVTLAAVETGDPAAVRTAIANTMAAEIPGLLTCACGEGPILVTMRVAAGLGADTVTLLGYANSADSPQGSPDQVVGYGAAMFWRYEPPDLTEARQEELLKLARTAIAEYLETSRILDQESNDPVLARRSGAFITLKKGDALRGCIGHMQADTPLYRAVQEMAVSAAISDPRFPPLTAEELDEVNIEISVLSPLRRVTDVEQIQVGAHGLLINQSGRQGVLLPQVPVEQGWNRQEFLVNLCLKAGLPDRCWTDQPALYAFTAVVFRE